ncbi:hypothetical protein L593_00380 [Salinarchaeum sp. Harcht-Bsk1]|nr:hypothetical protein L593_00380 [Salinarchaeum sp. Harcht-Bsk1]
MDEDTVASYLERQETGVLSLADDGDAYAVPIAHYYDDGNLYFRLGRTEDSQKWEAIEATDTAAYVCYGTAETTDPRELESWSVLASGPLRELPPEEAERFDAAEINEHFPPIRVFGESIDEVDVVILELEVESVIGRTTPDA